MNEPCFDQLERKCNWVISYSPVQSLMRAFFGIRIIIQSGKCGPVKLDEHVESFLKLFREEHLGTMTEEDFIKHRNSLIMEKIKKARTMREETYSYFGEIQNRMYCFDRNWKEAAELDTTSLNDVIEFFDSYIAVGAPERKNSVSRL